ncbi:MAG: YhdP family protein [Pseudomonadales bacterium]
MRTAGRLLLAVALALTVLVALFQVAGRVATLWVNDTNAAALLARFAPDLPVAASGIEIRWHRFNPVLTVNTLQLGDSRVTGVVAKLDWLESLWRRGLVLRHLRNDAAQMQFVQSASGAWGLAGMPAGPGGLDWRVTVEHTDQMQLSAQLQFADILAAAPTMAADSNPDPDPDPEVTPEPEPNALTVAVQARNEDARRRWSLQLMEPRCGAQCLLAVELEERLRIPMLQSASLAIAASVIGTGVRLPAALLGGTSLRVTQADVRWDASRRDWRRYLADDTGEAAEQELAGRLEIALQLADVQLPGGVPFDVALSARGSSHPGYALARSFSGTVTQGDTVVSLPEFWLRWVPDRVQLFAQRLDLTTALAQVARSRNDSDALGRWLRALQIHGLLTGLQAQARLDVGGWAWQAQLSDGATTGYLGAPTADSLSGRVFGYERGLRADIAAPRSTIGFPGVFADLWLVRDFSAQLDLHWHRDYLSLLGQRVNAQLVQGDASAPPLDGTFRLAVPANRLEQTLALAIRTPALSFATAKRFLPSKLNPELRRWLLTALESGSLSDVQYAYLGHVRGQQGAMARRSALRAELADATVQFDPRWPLATGVGGTFELSGQEARAVLTAGSTGGLQLAGTSLRAPPGAREVELSLQAQFDGSQGLAYILDSPLQQSLPFVTPDWRGAGPMRVAGQVRVPIAGPAGRQPQSDLSIQLQNVDLDLPAYRLAFVGLNGPLRFRSPNQLTGTDLGGTLLGESLGFAVRSDAQGVSFDVTGDTNAEQVCALLAIANPGFATGSTRYTGTVSFPTGGAAPVLDVETDLQGMALALPGELGKSAAARRPTRIRSVFAEDQQVQVTQAPLLAALQVADGAVAGGTVELRGAAPLLATEYLQQARTAAAAIVAPGVVISGALSELPLGTGGEGGLFGPVPVRLDGLQVNALRVDEETDLGAVAISGTMQGENFDLALFGAGIAGQVLAVDAAPLAVRLSHVHLPGSDRSAQVDELDVQLVADPAYRRDRVQVNTVVPAAADPLPVTLIKELPAATVEVAKVMLGDDDFGSWQFTMEPAGETLRVTNLLAKVRGLQIDGAALTWHTEPNETRFSGTLTAVDLAEVLPQWDFAPTLSSTSATIDTAVQWPGSPANINLLTMNGEVDFVARNGRFADVETGNNALRIFSLLNFNALTKRMNLDFSDVVGRGISFEEIVAPVALASGDLRFRSPMSVNGTGSSFRLDGRVDLDTGALANDMVVTLPLTKGLPWYAAYVAIANPLAGLGVLVGERVLRKPLEQFSSARYRITGTLDAPKAKLVSIFDNEMETQVPDEVAVPANLENSDNAEDSLPTEATPSE